MMRLDATRVRAVVRKELRDYRRKRSIVVAMVILPAIFLVQPTLSVFLGSPASSEQYYPLPLLLLLLIRSSPLPPSPLTPLSASASRGRSSRCSRRHFAGKSSSWERRRRS